MVYCIHFRRQILVLNEHMRESKWQKKVHHVEDMPLIPENTKFCNMLVTYIFRAFNRWADRSEVYI